MDLAFLQHLRHRHDQRELRQRAAEIVGHADHRAIVLAGEDDLRRLVEKRCVGLADIEAAEGRADCGNSAAQKTRAASESNARTRAWQKTAWQPPEGGDALVNARAPRTGLRAAE